ncbi:pentatricopeptide repeat-containing protein At3g29290-like isoform X2 [Coffea arabica]|uniref:Pentatricopeptide repeat-containing protein At3g29290-like isoform X2 n=1 Tax=Coffea arabica TaxID=13443 RepID=A0ABM4V7J1_COFAR|nr:pentatricopeptide repeat-containing protein At3g29290 isoform X2 [Coffea arabica]
MIPEVANSTFSCDFMKEKRSHQRRCFLLRLKSERKGRRLFGIFTEQKFLKNDSGPLHLIELRKIGIILYSVLSGNSMVGVLRHPPAIGISSNGFTQQPCLSVWKAGQSRYQYCPTPCSKFGRNKSSVNNIKGLDMVNVSDSWYTCFRAATPSIRRLSVLISEHVTCKVGSFEHDLVRDEQKAFSIAKESKQLNESSLEQNVPSQESLLGREDLLLQEAGGCAESSGVSEGTVNPLHGRFLYLEERNEEMLSRRLLKLCRLNKVRSAFQLYKSMEFLGLRPNSHACNSMVSCLLRNDMIDDALRIFYSMKARGETTGHTCSLILKAVADARGCDTALSMFEELERNKNVNKSFDAIVYNTMLSVFSKANDWVQTENIWRRMQHNGHSGTTVTYRVLVCTFVRCGLNELAIDAYHEMLWNGLTPGEDAMHAIIGACVKEGKWDLALTVFQNMLKCGLKPNLIACNALLNSLGKAGKLNLAFKVYDAMKSLGHAPDAYTCNALLGALNKVNQHADAIQLFENIRREQISVLSLQVYHTVLMSYQKLGLWERALQLLWQMEASEMHLTSAPYNLVIGACEVAKQPKVALQIYDHMVHQKCSPDIFTLLSLIRSCIWGSLWDKVEDILNNPPSGYLYNASVQGLFLRGNIDFGMRLYAKMKELNLNVDGKTRAMVLQNLSKDPRRV